MKAKIDLMYLGEDVNGFLVRYGGNDGPMKLVMAGDELPKHLIPLAVANPEAWIGVEAS